MSGSVNKVILIGRLGKDPVTRTNNGSSVTSFSMATSETWRDKATGERKEKTEWHNVVIFNEALGKVAQTYLKKGSNVFIEGAMQTRKWTDQAGLEKYSTEVVLKNFRGDLTLLDSAGGRPAPSEGDYGTTSTRPETSADSGLGRGGGSTAAMIDDDIPF